MRRESSAPSPASRGAPSTTRSGRNDQQSSSMPCMRPTRARPWVEGRVSAPTRPNDEASPSRPTVAQLTRYFLKLGATGFGGPIALVGDMDRTLVQERGWVTRQEFADGLAFCQLAPGPLAAQLAIYLGWLRAGVRGATAAGSAFIAPSFVMVVVLALAYRRLGGMPWLQGAFYGIGAAVIAVIARSAYKLAKSTLRGDRLLWMVFAASAL